METPTIWDLREMRGIANFQFGRRVGTKLFPKSVKVMRSPRTGKLRHIRYKDQLLATIQAKTGRIALTLQGARRLLKAASPPTFRVIVINEAVQYVSQGRTAFAKYVEQADPNIRPGDEVIVVDRKDNLLAVGKAVLNGREMVAFQRGVAVKIRKSQSKNKL